MKRILIVCTGNTCRSPLAEYLLRHKSGHQFDVQSAGISALEGQQAASNVSQLLGEMGIQTKHMAQCVTPELMEWADLVLVMTQAHQQALISQFPEKAESIHTLKGYVHPDEVEVNISDPVGGSLDIYRATMDELDRLLDELIEKEKPKN